MKSLLLIIDLQQGWRHETATEEAMLNTVELAKRFAGDVIHCCFRNDETSLFYKELAWSRFFTAEDTAEIAEIQPLTLPIYWRSTYSCVNDETAKLIKQYDRVYICGVFTDVSVAATAMNIFDLGVPVGIVSDCVATLHGEATNLVQLRAFESIVGAKNLLTAAGVLAKVTTEQSVDY